MGVIQLTPLIERINTTFVHISETAGSLQQKQALLLELGDLLANDQLAPDDERLMQLSEQLDVMLGNEPGWGAMHDQLVLDVRTAANELVVESNDPDLQNVWGQVLDARSDNSNYRENMLVLNQQLPFHDTLPDRMTHEPSPWEADFLSLHRLCRDKMGLLATFTWQSCDNLGVAISDLLVCFEDVNNPAVLVQQKNDNIPVALLPVRAETRFMVIKHIRNNKVFTTVDDAFRSDTDVAIANDLDRAEALSYESVDPRGGAPDVLQPCSAQELIPDEHELWVRIYPDDLAMHTHEGLLTQDEIDTAQVYWEEVWRAYTNTNRQLGAWRVLAGAYGPERAAWIAKQTTPTNGNAQPATELPDGTPFTTPLTPPALPALVTKPETVTQAPHTNVMPDCFVVRVYDLNSSAYREVVGRPVPSPLPVGFNPSGNYTNYLNQDPSGLNMPPELRWMTDFEEAEQVGMGIRIPLQGNERNDGFSRLLVLGLKLSASPTDSKQLLEELFDNHHYRTGLALVPQGTPTNNTTGAESGFAGYDPGKELSFAVERKLPLFTSSATHYLKADGQRLAEALGISPVTFEHVANSDKFDGKESIAMNRALWSATLGNYMTNHLTPAVLPADVANTRTFFTNYVHGRGLIPAFRVKNQPYGVLTSTVYSRWKYSNPLSFEAKLHSKILQPLNLFWDSLAANVKRIGASSADPGADLTDILGLHPASISFYQRISCGAYMLWNLQNFIAGTPSSATTFYSQSTVTQLDSYYQNLVGISYLSIPRIFGMNFVTDDRLLNGPVIDLLPLSETRITQNILNATVPGSNYLHWLQVSPLSYIRNENFTNLAGALAGQAPPRALLYLLLRHAMFLEYIEASHCLLTNAGVVTRDARHNHELINVSMQPDGRHELSQEQRDMLFGVVKAEVLHETEVVIDDIMQNLSTNQDYLESGLTPEQYHQQLWDNAAPQIEQFTQEQYDVRIEDYNVEQAQWDYVVNAFAEVSGTATMEDHLFNLDHPCTQQLNEVRDALSLLKTLPTARLERLLAEHLDTCSYRLDAWMNALVTQRLLEQRATTPDGIHLGAYSILERVTPGGFPGIHVVNVSNIDSGNTWQSTAASLGAQVELSTTAPGESPTRAGRPYVTPIGAQYQPATFIYLGDDPTTRLIEDRATGRIIAEPRVNADNQGFILSPSLTHAVTAAILRAGYKSHENTGSPFDTFAVNLSSARVRTALYYIEGIRNGQTLGALLGYQFERALHDRYSSITGPPYPLDGYIADIRKKYPLVAGGVIPTPSGASNNDAQAHNVTDGLKLIEAYRKTTPAWDAGITIPSADKAVIVSEINNIENAMDAVGDLLLAESVYQVARGNNTRSGSVLSALGRGTTVPEPEIVKTPRQHTVLTHRFMVQLDPATAAANTWTGTGQRALSEPALNNWLATQLPDPAMISIRVSYTDGSGPQQSNITIDDLDLQPIDLVAMFSAPGNNQQEDASELSQRVTYHVRKNLGALESMPVTIDYRSRANLATTDRTIFELLPILRGLVQVTGKSRALQADDFLLPNEANNEIAANQSAGPISSLLFNRLDDAVNSITAPLGMTGVLNALGVNSTSGARGAADALVYPTTAPFTPPTGAAAVLNTLRDVLMSASLFGIERAIPETAVSDSVEARDALVAQAARVSAELSARITKAGGRLPGVGAITGEKAKVKELEAIAQDIYGRAFKVFAEFTLYNSDTMSNTSPVTDSLALPNLLVEGGPFAIDEWMQGVSRVRPRMGEYRKLMLLSESVTGNSTAHRVAQLPHDPSGDGRWLGMQLPQDYEPAGDTLSMVMESSSTLTGSGGTICGMLVDEWTEHIPLKDITTGIAMHYDQPNNEAPQSILLAVTPEVKGYWAWNDLMDTLNETVGMAAKRAVEPAMIQQSDLSQVLPALVMQMTGATNTSPSLDLGRNIAIVNAGLNDPLDMSTQVVKPLDPNNLDINNLPSN